MKKVLSMAWAGLANLASLAANLYLVAFLANLDVPGADVAGAPVGEALAANAGLILLFGLQHSLMARDWFKERWTAVVPAHLERALLRRFGEEYARYRERVPMLIPRPT